MITPQSPIKPLTTCTLSQEMRQKTEQSVDIQNISGPFMLCWIYVGILKNIQK